jgi:hypothetical protein
MKGYVTDALDNINARDAEARVKAEHELLAIAESLTNGKSGCNITHGAVLLGLTKKTIEISSNCREIIKVLPTLQTKHECYSAQQSACKPRGLNISTNIAILTTIGMVLGFLARLLGWWG